LTLFRIGALPAEPVAAAATFYSEVVPLLERALIDPLEEGGDDASLELVFAPADHTHRAWRLAAVQALALAHTPLRINAFASDDGAGVTATEGFLVAAPGITGQYWALDGNGAGEVLL
jgi:hypothetical protein